MTLGDIRTYVKQHVNHRRIPGPTATGLIDRYANEAVRAVLVKTRAYVTTSDISLVAGTQDYQLPATVLAVLNGYIVGSGGQSQVFEPITLSELLDLRKVTPAGNVYHFAMAGSNLLSLYPNPSAAGTLRLYVVPKPTVMSADANDPSDTVYGGIPVDMHPAIEYYVLWRLGEYVGDKNAQVYRDRYEETIAEARVSQLKKRGKLPRARLAVGGRVSGDRSVYP